MKHTKGPWRPLTFSNHELRTDFAMVQIGDSAHMIGYSEQDFADAELIAAAPDLLEERDKLKAVNAELLEALKYMVSASFALDDTGYDARAVARAAIAKAEGL